MPAVGADALHLHRERRVIGLGLRIAAVGGRVILQVGLEDRFQRDAVTHGIHNHRSGASQREWHQQGRTQGASRVSCQGFVRTVKTSVDRSTRRHAVGHHQLLDRAAVLFGVVGRVAPRIFRLVVTACLRASHQAAAQFIGSHRRAAVPVQAGRHPGLGLTVARRILLGGVVGQFRLGHAVHGRDTRELGRRVGCQHVVVVVERECHAQGVHPRCAERKPGRRSLGCRIGQHSELAVSRQRIARIGVGRTRGGQDYLAAAEIVVEGEYQVVLAHLYGIPECRVVGHARSVDEQVGLVGQLPHLDLLGGEARILRSGAHRHRRFAHIGRRGVVRSREDDRSGLTVERTGEPLHALFHFGPDGRYGHVRLEGYRHLGRLHGHHFDGRFRREGERGIGFQSDLRDREIDAFARLGERYAQRSRALVAGIRGTGDPQRLFHHAVGRRGVVVQHGPVGADQLGMPAGIHFTIGVHRHDVCAECQSVRRPSVGVETDRSRRNRDARVAVYDVRIGIRLVAACEYRRGGDCEQAGYKFSHS